LAVVVAVEAMAAILVKTEIPEVQAAVAVLAIQALAVLVHRVKVMLGVTLEQVNLLAAVAAAVLAVWATTLTVLAELLVLAA